MPKRDDPNRPKPALPDGQVPKREDVEHAIAGILDRLRPKPRRTSTSPTASQERKPDHKLHLTLVRDAGRDGS